MNKKNSNQKGATIIMITILVMTSILAVGLSLSNIVVNGLKVSRTQANATQAYFAAEAGAERILWEIRKDSFDPWDSGCNNTNNYINPSFDACVGTVPLAMNSLTVGEFYIRYATTTATTTLSNFGLYKGTRRSVQLKY